MPRLASSCIPSYRLHRASGQAVVTLNRVDHYLGIYDSADSRAAYDRLTAEWLAAGRRLTVDPAGITIVELFAAFRRHALDYYRDGHGKLSRAVENYDEAFKPVLKMFGMTRAIHFGPLSLKVVRDSLITAGRVRMNINRHMARIKAVFAWGVENELLPPSVHHALMAIKGLRAGRCGAIEGEPVKPVPIEHVEAVLPFLSRQVRSMVELQILTGMRPGEIVIMRGIDLDTTGELWTYTPAKHKTQHHGHTRTVYLGPKAQTILRPLLRSNVNEFLFSPADAEVERRRHLHAARRTPMSCGNKPGSNRKRRPDRQPGECYTVASYYNSVRRACDVADKFHKGAVVIGNDERVIPRWHIHQLRHRAATDLRKQHGLEVAQVMLGHSRVETAQIYAEKNSILAQRVALAVG